MWGGVAAGPRRLPARLARPAWHRFSFSERALRVATLAVASAFVLSTTLGVSGLVERSSAAFGASTTLTVLGGEVTVSGDGSTFASAVDGDVLRAGTTVRTSANAYAVITYFDGSSVSIDPNTTVTIAALGLDPDGTKTISLRQELGRTWHVVRKLLTGSSRYEVLTPVMTASVRGTMFAVAVTPDLHGDVVAELDTVEGTVAASLPGQAAPEVLVPAGFRATATGSAIGPVVPISEPDRVVTVTIGANSGVVIDDIGRSNGLVGDEVVAQTPGAKIERRGGELVVKLPDVRDGRIVVVTRSERARSGAVGLFTDLTERRRSTMTTKQRIPADGSGLAVATVDIRRAEAPAVGTPASDDEKSALAARANTGGSKKDDDKTKRDEGDGGPGGPGGPGGFALDAPLPSVPFGTTKEQTTHVGDVRSTNDQPTSGQTSATTRSGSASGGGGFVPSASLPEIPTLIGPTSKEPAPASGGPQPADKGAGTDRSGTDTRGGSDRGGGKPDTKGKP